MSNPHLQRSFKFALTGRATSARPVEASCPRVGNPHRPPLSPAPPAPPAKPLAMPTWTLSLSEKSKYPRSPRFQQESEKISRFTYSCLICFGRLTLICQNSRIQQYIVFEFRKMPKKNECLLAKIGVITAETGPDRVEMFPKIEKSRRFMATTDRHLFSGFAFR